MLSGSDKTLAVFVLALPGLFLPAADCLGGGGEFAGPRWGGTLDIGTVRYEVSFGVVSPTGGLALSEVSLSLQGQAVAAAKTCDSFIVPAIDETASRSLGVAAVLFVSADMRLTESEIRANGYKKLPAVGVSSNVWWESTNTVRLLEDLPVKVRLYYEVCGEDAERVRYRVSRITVYSLGEWNNRLNDNLVLRLEHLGGKEKCARQSTSRP